MITIFRCSRLNPHTKVGKELLVKLFKDFLKINKDHDEYTEYEDE